MGGETPACLLLVKVDELYNIAGFNQGPRYTSRSVKERFNYRPVDELFDLTPLSVSFRVSRDRCFIVLPYRIVQKLIPLF